MIMLMKSRGPAGQGMSLPISLLSFPIFLPALSHNPSLTQSTSFSYNCISSECMISYTVPNRSLHVTTCSMYTYMYVAVVYTCHYSILYTAAVHINNCLSYIRHYKYLSLSLYMYLCRRLSSINNNSITQ